MCDNLIGEEWRDIPGYEGLYQVSNMGRVRSFKNGGERIRKLQTDKRGYVYVSLTRNGKTTLHAVHRLVAIAFIPNPENKPEVDHVYGDKTDNRVENLRWVTSLENMRHARDTGRINQNGEASCNAKFNNRQVEYIRNNPDGLTQRQLAERYSVSQSTIGEIQRGKTFRYRDDNRSTDSQREITTEYTDASASFFIKE